MLLYASLNGAALNVQRCSKGCVFVYMCAHVWVGWGGTALTSHHPEKPRRTNIRQDAGSKMTFCKWEAAIQENFQLNWATFMTAAFFLLETVRSVLKSAVSDHGEGFMLIPRLSLTNMHNNAYALGMLTGQRFLDPYFIDAVRVIRIYSSTQLLPLFA